MPAPVLAAMAIGGALKSFFGNRSANAKAKADAANQRLMMQHGIDTKNKSRKRKASTMGSLLRQIAKNPEVYGKYFSADMFGQLPGALTADDLNDPNAPEFQAGGGGGFGSLLTGAIGGAEQYFANQSAAENDAGGMIQGSANSRSRGGGSGGTWV